MAEDSHDTSGDQLVKRAVIEPQARTNRNTFKRLARQMVSKLQRTIFRKTVKRPASRENLSPTQVSRTTLKTNDDKLI